MDRNDALAACVPILATSWLVVFAAFIPDQEYASPYGSQVICYSTIAAIVIGLGLVVAYYRWPIALDKLDDLREHYDEVRKQLDDLSKFGYCNLTDIPVRNALLHLEGEAPNARKIFLKSNGLTDQRTSVMSEIDKLVTEISGVKPDDTTRRDSIQKTLAPIWERYLESKDPLQTIQSKLRIESKPAVTTEFLYLDQCELYRGDNNKLMELLQQAKKCLNDARIVSKLENLRKSQDELQLDKDRMSVACKKMSSEISGGRYRKRKKCCPIFHYVYLRSV